MIRTPLQRRTRLRTTASLGRTGRRGRRLRREDRRQERLAHALPCVCGCSAGRGEVARAHLERRSIESTRNEDSNNLPTCWWLGEWLDHTPEGVQARASLWAMAIGLGRRLTGEDVRPLLREYGYYEWRMRAGG